MSDILHKVGKLFVGDILPEVFIFCMLLAYAGAFCKMMWNSRRARVKHLPYSPNRFSWDYWVNDNSKRIAGNLIANAIVIYLFIRFGDELTSFLGINIPEGFKIVSSFFIGLGVDKLANKLKRNGLLATDPEKNPARIEPKDGEPQG